MQTYNPQRLFGTSVKVSRNQLGISQEILAERSKLHRTYISDVERGARNPSLKTILRLAQALEVSVSTLFPAALQHWRPNDPRGSDLGPHSVDILLVEDNADDVELTLHAFKQARFANRIHVALDGDEALNYLFCHEPFAQRQLAEGPQLILLDLSLPTLSGLEVLRLIKGDPRTAHMPVVVLTGSNALADIAECRRLGAVTYITKPLDWHGFGAAIKQINLSWVLLQPPESLPAPAAA